MCLIKIIDERVVVFSSKLVVHETRYSLEKPVFLYLKFHKVKAQDGNNNHTAHSEKLLLMKLKILSALATKNVQKCAY